MSCLAAAEIRIQLFQQFGIVGQRALKNRRLLASRGPVARLGSLSQAGQFQVSVGITCAVENVLETRGVRECRLG